MGDPELKAVQRAITESSRLLPDERITALTKLFPAEKRSVGLRRAIAKISDAERPWTLAMARKLESISTADELATTIEVLQGIPKAERGRFIEIAQSFDGTHPSIILPFLNRIQTDVRINLIKDIKESDPSGRWLLSALPLERMRNFFSIKRPLIFDRVKTITRPGLEDGLVRVQNRFTWDEIKKLDEMSDEEFQGLQYLFGTVMGNTHGLLHDIFQLPSADFQECGTFITRFREMYRPERPLQFFFPLLKVRASERERCLNLWEDIMNLSHIPTDANAFHLKAMTWLLKDGERFISLYQSFLAPTMNDHDRRVLLDQFLSPSAHCHVPKYAHSSVDLIQAVGNMFVRDISRGLEEQHRFGRLVDLIENPETSLDGFFKAQREREALLQARRDLERRRQEQRETEERLRAQALLEQQEGLLQSQRIREQLRHQQEIRESLAREGRVLDVRAEAIPAFDSWALGQEAMMAERTLVTTALLTVLKNPQLDKFKPNHSVEDVFEENYQITLPRLISLRMSGIIKRIIGEKNASLCSRLVHAAIDNLELYVEKDPCFVYDQKFPALRQFFKFLRSRGGETPENERFAFSLLESTYERECLRNPPSDIDHIPFKAWASRNKTEVQGCLAAMKKVLLDKEYFRLETALRGIEMVGGIRSDYTYDSRLPGIKFLCGFLGNLCNSSLILDNFVVGWIHEHARDNDMKRVFPELNEGLTLGEAFGMKPLLQKEMVKLLMSAFTGNETIRPHSLSLIRRFTKDYLNAKFDAYNSLVDALFMVRRGHAAPGQITNVLWPDQPACADGVYVGLARSLTEIEVTQLIASTISGLTVVRCS